MKAALDDAGIESIEEVSLELIENYMLRVVSESIYLRSLLFIWCVFI